ncbi:signal peptidase II [Geotalea uraniireducens]|uniref:Lipoprotein signal peptidase n=1 Tax=Geotalea uraniireducens (strain Rf4) TaxID=351605 RepID=A5G9I9_GEOUR|nr:signal peptidase II [Geotalea uraniireducens]ABQ28457.1 signal peptidase II, Aspartic peptidase, MEROPS family A08 [Geotalea uraniireducens Rf4]
MKLKYLILLTVSILVIGIDQATKLFVNKVMDLHSSITVVQNFFNITYMRNKGAAFSFLSNFNYRIPFFILVSLVAVVVIISVIYKLRPDQKFAALSLSLILSGALGNLIDRVRLGEVIDFLDAHWYEHHWPAFNVADSAICVGVFLLAIDMFLEEQRQKKQKD